MDLPVLDSRGGSLVSWVPVGEAGEEPGRAVGAIARSLVVVACDHHVLLGFHVLRQQWEPPGGALEPGESAAEAAARELAEEAGIRAEGLTLAAHAEFLFGAGAARHWAAVFVTTVDARPIARASEEMTAFGWWEVGTDRWDGLSPIDAEVARRAVPAGV